MTYPAEVLADSPLVYWRLGEPSGTTAADASGNGHTGTYLSSPQLGVTGLVGDADTAIRIAAGFPDRRVESASTVHVAGLVTAFALECLVTVAGGSGPDSLVMTGDPAVVAAGGMQLAYGSDDAAIGFSFSGDVGFVNVQAIVANGAHHVVGVWDGVNARIYIDGERIDSIAPADTGAPFASTWSLGAPYVGTGGSNSNAHDIDEVALYTHALSATRIREHAVAAGFSPAPLANITSVAPDHGPVAGGTEVVITGTGFTGVTSVDFGPYPAAAFTVDSDTQITATAPDLTIDDPGGGGFLLSLDGEPSGSEYTFDAEDPDPLPAVEGCPGVAVIDNTSATLLVADGLTVDANGLLWSCTGLDGWWDYPTLDVAQAHDQIVGARVNARTIGLELIAYDPAGLPLGVAMGDIFLIAKSFFACTGVPFTIVVDDHGALGPLSALIRRIDPVRCSFRGQRTIAKIAVTLTASNPLRYDSGLVGHP